jgi:RNA polymerase sigma-70 factor (ECF subfamily)
MNPTQIFEEHRPLLFSIAYRMLGSAADAEDMLQEAFLKWQQGSGPEVESPRAFLSTIVTRLCLNHLKSAKVRREEYVGPWLPEPIMGEVSEPDHMAKLADSLSMAFLVVLENLTPLERAVFLLRDIFDYDFGEVSAIVGKSGQNCRQILSRARRKIFRKRPSHAATREQKERIVEKFLKASMEGSAEDLLALFSEDITLYSDGGGKVLAALNPIYGQEKVLRFIQGILKKRDIEFAEIRVAEINGEPGILTYIKGKLFNATVLDIQNGRIRNLFLVSNPEKLRRLT